MTQSTPKTNQLFKLNQAITVAGYDDPMPKGIYQYNADFTDYVRLLNVGTNESYALFNHEFADFLNNADGVNPPKQLKPLYKEGDLLKLLPEYNTFTPKYDFPMYSANVYKVTNVEQYDDNSQGESIVYRLEKELGSIDEGLLHDVHYLFHYEIIGKFETVEEEVEDGVEVEPEYVSLERLALELSLPQYVLISKLLKYNIRYTLKLDENDKLKVDKQASVSLVSELALTENHYAAKNRLLEIIRNIL